MKIAYSWLKNYVSAKKELDLTAEAVSVILTDTGLEVEGLERIGVKAEYIADLIIGKVRVVKDHPNADRLKIAEVDVGEEKDLHIVCGAPNIEEGQTVVVAPIGATLHPFDADSFKIKKAKIRGEESEGMICAEDEIGMSANHDEIIVLEGSIKVGESAADHLATVNDDVFDIGLTPNRSDAMSHYGTAKDLVAYLNLHTKNTYENVLPDVSAFKPDNNDLQISVEVKNEEACPRYSGVTISGLKVAESPDWLKQRLQSIGIHPMNNVIDITNFVLWEAGQPLHAFDAEKIKGGKIIVQTLPQDTPFTTLDEEKRKLDKHDLMICNAEEGMCIAGVFGGLNSGVHGGTTSIFLESAYFDPTYVRRTSLKHGLKTDAAVRFEKGADPEMTIYALKRAALLMKEIAGGSISSEIVDVYPNPIRSKKVHITYDYINTLVGIDIPKKTIAQILGDLDIKIIKEDGKILDLEVPAYRYDVNRPADIVEELLRIYGYNLVETEGQVKYSLHNSADADSYMEAAGGVRSVKKNDIAGFLSSNGFNETINVPFVNSSIIQKLDSTDDGSSKQNGQKRTTVELLNSVNTHLNILRPNLFFSALTAINYNLNRNNRGLKFYEFGKIYLKKEGAESKSKDQAAALNKYEEEERLLLSITGTKNIESWSTTSSDVGFYYLKSFVEGILDRGGISYQSLPLDDHAFLKYGLSYSSGKNEVLVNFGEVQNAVLQSFEIDQPVFIADINWDLIDRLITEQSLEFKQIPKVPSIRRDLALLIDQSITFEQIINIAKAGKQNLLKEVNLFDVYEGKHIEEGKKSYAVSFIFQDEKKTLTDDTVESVMRKLVNDFKKELNAQIR